MQQRLSLLQVEGVEAFDKPAVHLGKELARIRVSALIAPKPRQSGCGAQLQRFCRLGPGNVDRLAQPGFCLRVTTVFDQEQGSQREQLRLQETLPGPSCSILSPS